MGLNTTVNTEVYFNRETFNHKSDVKSKIKECEEFINSAKQSLVIFASLNPTSFIEKDDEGYQLPIEESIKNKLNKTLEDFEDNIVEKCKLEYALDNWHTRQGDFVQQDGYYKYLGNEMLGLYPNRIYGVNKERTFNNKTKYWVLNKNWDFIPINEEEFNKLFKESTYEEYNKQSF